MGKKNKNNLILGGLLAVVLLLAVGYAAFATNLNINGTSSIDSRWDVHIKNGGVNADPNNTVAAESITAQKDSQLTGSFSCNLTTPGISTIDYIIEVENSGTFGAKLSSINITGETAFIGTSLSKSSLKQGDVIAGNGGSDTITVTVSYKDVDIVPTLAADKTVAITVTLNFVQDGGAALTVSNANREVTLNFEALKNISDSTCTNCNISPITANMNDTITLPVPKRLCYNYTSWSVSTMRVQKWSGDVLVSDIYDDIRNVVETYPRYASAYPDPDGNELTLYGNWSTKTVTTRHNYEYDGLSHSVQRNCSATISFPLSRDGYTLDGWYTSPNGQGMKVTDETTGGDLVTYLNLGIDYDQDTPIDLYANWIAN